MIEEGRSIATEYRGAELGDSRRTSRLEQIAARLEHSPADGFPRALGSDAELEAFYRFINNDAFVAEQMLAPHRRASVERCVRAKSVVAVHDTSHFDFSTDREGLGVTTANHRGFIGHISLVLSERERLPLGVLHVEPLTRSGKKWIKRRREGQRGRVNAADETRESLRWLRGLEAVESLREERFDVVHVADAEGDFFELLAAADAASARFVIRAGQLDRQVYVDGAHVALRDAVSALAPTTQRKITLSERRYRPKTVSKARKKRHPERSARTATISMSATPVTLPTTHYSRKKSGALNLNVVRIWEASPPPDEPAVEWILFTTEDVSSAAALERIVDIYRMRWTIEEYFKALKSGCAIEKRQIESYDALKKVLALFIPIAYRLLLLRAVERIDSTAQATLLFTQEELHLMEDAPSNRGLAPPRTIHDALLHLARLGGHLRNNGPPGWQTLAWGYEKLLLMKIGWQSATTRRSDQS